MQEHHCVDPAGCAVKCSIHAGPQLSTGRGFLCREPGNCIGIAQAGQVGVRLPMREHVLRHITFRCGTAREQLLPHCQVGLQPLDGLLSPRKPLGVANLRGIASQPAARQHGTPGRAIAC